MKCILFDLKKVKKGIVRAQNKNGIASCFHQSQSQTTDQSVLLLNYGYLFFNIHELEKAHL